MKRALLLAAIVVLCCSPLAMAVNSVVINDQSATVGQTGLEVPIFLTNDVSLRTMGLPLIIRDVNPGGFPTQVAMKYRERLGPGVVVLYEIQITNQYPGGDTATACGHGFGTFLYNDTLGHAPTDNPWGVYFFRNKIFTASLAPGTDANGSCALVMDVGAGDGTFEIDTTCTNPSNHVVFIPDAAASFTPDFTKGTITVGTGGGGGNTPPTAMCQNLTLDADANCEATATAAQVNNGSTDTEDGSNLTLALDPPGPYSLGENFVNLIVTDQGGLADTCQSIITVQDVTPPSVTCELDADTIAVGANCQATLPGYFNINVSDNCSSNFTTTQNPPQGTLLDRGEYTVWTIVADEAGNKDSCSFTVTVIDDTPPVVSCPGDTTLSNEPGQCGATVNFSSYGASDPCGVTLTIDPQDGSFFPIGTTQVTLIATNDAGLADTCTFNVTVEDTELPTLSGCPNDTTVECLTDVPAPASVIAADNCPGGTLDFNEYDNATGNACGGTITRVWTATDNAGNKDSCVQVVTVDDITAPQITCPVNVSTPEDGPGQGAVVTFNDATATDNCTASPTVTQIAGLTSGSTFPVGLNDVSFEAVDDCGNADTCTFTITVTAVGAPVVAACKDTTVEADGNCEANVTPEMVDGGSSGYTGLTLSPSGPYPLGSTVVMLIATNDQAEADTCEATITVIDTTPPSLTCPTVGAPIAADANCEWEVPPFDPAASDNCGIDHIDQFPTAGTFLGLGVHDISLVAYDASGNKDSCAFSVEIIDNTPPVITCNGTWSNDNDQDQCSTVADYASSDWATATDNCGNVTITYDPPSGTTFPIGTTQVMAVATDDAGNADTCYFDVDIFDSQLPTIVCPGNITVQEDVLGGGTAVVNWPDPTTSDNCPNETWAQSQGLPQGAAFPLGTTTNWLVVTDAAGNKDSCSFDVTVNAQTSEVHAICQNVTVDADANCEGNVTAADVNNGSTGQGVTLALEPAGPYPLGQTNVLLIVTDQADVADTCEATITVEDNTPPSIQCKVGDVAVDADANCEYQLLVYALAQNVILEDNCPLSDALTQNPPAGTIVGLGPHDIWLIATDGAGNKDSCSFVLTVEDNTPPEIQCAGTMVLENNVDLCGQLTSFTGWATATDNCDNDVTITYDPPEGFFEVGTTQVTAIATDDAGNADTCYFDVEVNDTQLPTVQCPPNIVDEVGCGENGKNVDFGVLADDNCDGVVLVNTPPAGSFFPIGTTTVWAVATDAAGNKDSCSFTVTINQVSNDQLVASPDTLYFSATAGGANPAPQSFDVTNLGCNPIDYQVEELIPWADANPLVGTTDDQVDVSVDITGLGAGVYWGTMYVGLIPNKGILVDDSVVICLTVESQCENAKVSATPDTISIKVTCLDKGADLCIPVYFGSDTEGCVLGWTTYYDDSTFIAGLTPDHGITPDTAELCFNVKQLEPGEYFECIKVYQTVIPGSSKILADDEICIHVIVEDCGQPEEASVAVGEICGQLGDTVTVPVTYCTNFDASGMQVGIDYNPSVLHVLDVSFDSSCINYISDGFYEAGLDDVSGHICIGAVPQGNDGPIPAGCCELARITFVITDDEGCPFTEPLTLVEEPAVKAATPICGVIFTDLQNNPVYPSLSNGAVCVECTPACEMCGSLKDVTGAPIPGMTVELTDTLGNVIATTATDVNGNWCFTDLQIGEYGIHVDAPGFCDYFQAFPCEQGPFNIVLEQCANTCEICVSVFDESGAALEGSTIELWSSYPDGVILDTCTTNANAYCCFEEVPTGQQYEVRVRKSGYCPQVFTVECGQEFPPVVLEKLPVIPTQPYAADWYSQNATVEGQPLVPGDVIIAMDPDGVICGVTTITNPGEYFIHVIGDDATTAGQDEGAQPGDEITLYYNCDCPLIAEGLWQPLSSNQFDAAFDCSRRTVEIPLCDDWTLISFNVLPPSPAVGDVLKSIDGEYQFLLSATCANGNISWDKDRPSGLNDLQTMDACHSYWVKPVSPGVGPIVIEGVPVEVDKPLYLCPGWDALPYLPNDDDSREHALASIDGLYEHVFTTSCEGILSWDENRPAELNDLYCLMPTKGYWIKMKEEATQTYPLSGYSCAPPPSGLAKPVNLTDRVKLTPRYADFWSANDVSATGLTPGDRITAKTQSGLIVGEALVNDKGWFLLHVYGDDPTTTAVDGAQTGEKLVFEVNGVTAASTGNSAWNERSSSEITVFAAGSNPVPTDFALLQNYPNPFNPSTTISYRLPDAANVNLTIYNVLGQSVRTLVSGYQEAGTHSVEWDGRSDNGSTVQSGIYFYRIDTPGFTEAKKMTLLK